MYVAVSLKMNILMMLTTIAISETKKFNMLDLQKCGKGPFVASLT